MDQVFEEVHDSSAAVRKFWFLLQYLKEHLASVICLYSVQLLIKELLPSCSFLLWASWKIILSPANLTEAR